MIPAAIEVAATTDLLRPCPLGRETCHRETHFACSFQRCGKPTHGIYCPEHRLLLEEQGEAARGLAHRYQPGQKIRVEFAGIEREVTIEKVNRTTLDVVVTLRDGREKIVNVPEERIR